MKHIKKFIGIVLAVVMMLAMSVPVMAANITVNGGASNSVYTAYRILEATSTESGDKTLYTYSVNKKYESALKQVTGKTDNDEIITYIRDLTGADVQTFADSMKEAIGNTLGDYTSQNGVFSDVDHGYYLIAETTLGGEGDSYSLVMLDTAGQSNINVKTKEDVPELIKKVKEKNDTTGKETDWQDGADYDIGDDVPFKLTGTVSEKYDSYKSYYYAFHDKMSSGLTLNQDSVTVKVDETELTNGEYDLKTTALEDGCTFEVIINDLKKLTSATVSADSKITVEFTAKLNEKAVIGSAGNPNEAKLEFSNNPYDEKDHTSTPWDKVTVFTYKIIANKVNEKGVALDGAGFTLYKYVKGEYVPVSNEIKGVTTFTFSGIDAGKYKLVETTVPTDYNKAPDLEFEVVATYDTNSADPTLTKLEVKNSEGQVISGENMTFTVNEKAGSVTTDVVNKSGTELPSTGGIGRTIFYVVGGTVMAAAAILLVVKRRMKNSGK